MRCSVRRTSKYAELEVRHVSAFAALSHLLNLQLLAGIGAGPKDTNFAGPNSLYILGQIDQYVQRHVVVLEIAVG